MRKIFEEFLVLCSIHKHTVTPIWALMMSGTICDRIWENPPYGVFFSENRVCNHATPPIIEKLPSKGVAMHPYGVSVHYAYTASQLNGPGWSRLK